MRLDQPDNWLDEIEGEDFSEDTPYNVLLFATDDSVTPLSPINEHIKELGRLIEQFANNEARP